MESGRSTLLKLIADYQNGSGKSTLLKLIAGQYEVDSGSLTRHKGANIAYLAQEPVMPEGATVLQAVLQSDSMVAKTVQNYQKAIESAGGSITKELEAAIDKMNVYNAWEIDSEAKRVLEAVGIPEAMFNQPVEKLSGGQHKRVALASALLGKPDLLILDEPTNHMDHKRVALASALLGKPDLLILDEPTNHMDVEMIDWMEKELNTPGLAVVLRLAVVLVTHDWYFMETVCDRMLEVDGGQSFMHSFGGPGSFERFKEPREQRRVAHAAAAADAVSRAREQRRAAQAAAAADARTASRREAKWIAREQRRAAQAAAAADARTLFRREAEWIVKQPQGRQAKQQARVKAFTELTRKTKDTPKVDLKADFQAGSMARLGNKIINLEDVCFEVKPGQEIIRDFTYSLNKGERLGIVGRNGTGKSTLLNLIAGINKPTSGKIDFGDSTVVGYFTQYPPPVQGDLRVINYIRELADQSQAEKAGIENVDTPEVVLEKYQFVSSLSGGERRRLHLASVLIERPNLLILDEPTNDLDLQTVEVLEEVCRNFQGVLLVVSHDRAFMDGVVDNLLVLKGDGIVRKFGGTYSEYREVIFAEKAEEEGMRQLELEEARELEAAAAKKVSDAASAASSSSAESSTGSGSKASGQCLMWVSGCQAARGSVQSAAQVQVPRPQSWAAKKVPDAASAATASSCSIAERSTGSGAKASGQWLLVRWLVSKKEVAKRRISYYETVEYERLTKEIDDLSVVKAKLDQEVMELAQSGTDLGALEKRSMDLAKAAEELGDL
eukprot:gene6245-2869_t